MGLDVRYPIGGLFAILGLLLAAYGLATRGAPGSEPTGIPIDLMWGLVMLGFGLVMLLLAKRARRI